MLTTNFAVALLMLLLILVLVLAIFGLDRLWYKLHPAEAALQSMIARAIEIRDNPALNRRSATGDRRAAARSSAPDRRMIHC